MGARFGWALVLALVWMLLTSRFNLQGFLTGAVIGLILLFFVKPPSQQVRWRRLPGQIWALVMYGLILYRDILYSGVDIARRVLSKDMGLKPGVVAVPVQDPEKSPLVTALSANALSLTPGELVIEIEANSILFVHTLNVERTAKNAAAEQAKRLQLLNRVMGREAE